MNAKKVFFDEPAGDLAIRAEEHGHAEVDDDGHGRAEHRAGVRVTSVLPLDDLAEARLHDNTGVLVLCQKTQLLVEPFSPPDDSGDEIIDGFTLHRHRSLIPLEGIVPGGEGAARGLNPTGVENVRELLPCIDDDSYRHHRLERNVVGREALAAVLLAAVIGHDAFVEVDIGVVAARALVHLEFHVEKPAEVGLKV